jgi:hypothetical protein
MEQASRTKSRELKEGGQMVASAREKQKQSLHELHQKFYGKKGKVAKTNEKIAQVVKEKKQPQVIEESAPVDPQAFASLKPAKITVAMMRKQAKEAGIKYHGILTKEELVAVLDFYRNAVESKINDPASIAGITEITNKAQARWKAGWGKEKGKEVK